jgi:hypothetical protein
MSQRVTDHLDETAETPETLRADGGVARPERRRRLPWRSLGWPAAVVVTVVVLAAVPVLFFHRFYFSGDTQAGAVPQWYYYGSQLRAGHWPLLDLSTWRAGNFAAEGQWGLFSPLTTLVALATTVVPNFVLFVTVLKTGLLVTGALGLYVLARSYGASQAAAYAGAVAVTIGGATQYLESPSWVTGQMVWALLPWAWWSFRRLAHDRVSPAPALVFGFLIVTVGYVYGTIFLALVIAACLVEAALARRAGGLVRVFVAGALCGLVALTIYLPGMLTAPVTTRSGFEVLSDGRLQTDLMGLLTSMLPTTQSPGLLSQAVALPSAGSSVGLPPPNGPSPVHFLFWFLPALVWLDAGRVRALARPMAAPYVMLGLMLAWALGPNQVGPIRWPQRVLPEVTMIVALVTVVLLSQALVRRPSPRRLVVSLLWVVASGYLVVSRFWHAKAMNALAVLVVAVFLTALWWAVRRYGFGLHAAGLVAAGCLAATVLQHAYLPMPAAMDRNMSARPADYRSAAATARGDVMVVGSAEPVVIAHPRATRDLLVASSWFLTDKPVQSVYSTIGFTRYNSRYCMIYNGSTCTDALRRLFTREPLTGQQRVDLLSVSTLVMIRKDFTSKQLFAPPEGWSVSQRSKWAVTWVRSDPLPPAGGVAWSSDGLDVETVSESARTVRLRVGPTQGGDVVLSRLAWPGYQAEGARLAAPVDDYLLTVRVPQSTSAQEVTVTYAPPGWPVEMAALAVALVGGVLWSLVAILLPLRRWRRQP